MSRQPVAEFECLACEYRDYRMSTEPVGDLLLEGCPKCHGDMVIRSKDIPEELESILNLVDEYFHIWDFVISEEESEFTVEAEDQKKSFSNLLANLRKAGYLGNMSEEEGELKLRIQKAPRIEKSNIWINIGLFIATIFTTFVVAGYWYLYDGNFLQAGLFSSSLLTILGTHELGHKLFAEKNKVKSTWPYFLPVPHPLIGTFGAVIKNKTPIPTKESLVEIGASGPLSGVIFALPISIMGLFHSSPGGEIFQTIPTPMVFALLGKVILNQPITSLDPHPLAWAGFIGLLVTWLNLLPTGQLDGGHIARSLLSKMNHFLLTRSIGFALLLLSFFWSGFLILSLLILFLIGNPHPGALDDVSELDREHKILAASAFTVFILCIPIPLWVV